MEQHQFGRQILKISSVFEGLYTQLTTMGMAAIMMMTVGFGILTINNGYGPANQ